jgi:multiple sugar transport system permease protein
MIPAEVTIFPNFVIIYALGWINTFQALILPFGANVFSIFLMRQAFLSLPRDLFDAALLDGASHTTYFRHVALPLTVSSVSVVGLLAFLRSWNTMLWPLIVTNSKEMRTLQVGLTMLTQEVQLEFPLLMAASTMTVIPILVLYLFTQRQFIEGISTTGMQ